MNIIHILPCIIYTMSHRIIVKVGKAKLTCFNVDEECRLKNIKRSCGPASQHCSNVFMTQVLFPSLVSRPCKMSGRWRTEQAHRAAPQRHIKKLTTLWHSTYSQLHCPCIDGFVI